MGKIICGYDGSDCSRAALVEAVSQAKAYGDDVVVVFGYAVSRLGGEVADYAAALKEHAEAVEKHANDQASAEGIEVEVRLVEEEPVNALVDIAEELGARAIVVGAHSESPLKGAIVGAVPHKLLQVSSVPIIAVPESTS
jgi:nucleotide-binding universal stress UspA family protein